MTSANTTSLGGPVRISRRAKTSTGTRTSYVRDVIPSIPDVWEDAAHLAIESL